MRTTRKSKKKNLHRKEIVNYKFQSDVYRARARTLGIVDLLMDFIRSHRKLWDQEDTYLKPWLKGILTSVANKLEKFVIKYGDVTTDIDREELENTRNYNKGLMLGVFEQNGAEQVILDINNGLRDVNFELFRTFTLLKATLDSLELDASVMAVFHRTAKADLNKIVKELNFYVKWWNKEVEETNVMG